MDDAEFVPKPERFVLWLISTSAFNLVDAVGVEPTQSYLSAGGLQPLELANAQHIHYKLALSTGIEPVSPP